MKIDVALQGIGIFEFFNMEEDRQIEHLNFYCRGYTNFTYKVTKINQYYFNRYVEKDLERIKIIDEDSEKLFNLICAFSNYNYKDYDNIIKALHSDIIIRQRKNKLLKIIELKN